MPAILHNDLEGIPIDEFTSTSGLYRGVLLQRLNTSGGHLTEYAVAILLAGTGRVLKMVHAGWDSEMVARGKIWESFKRRMTAPAGPQETDISMFDAFKKCKKGIHPDMPKLIPVNGTAIVEEIIEEDATLARAEAANIIVPDETRSELQGGPSTRGKIIAISSGFQNAMTTQGVPVAEGDIIWFGKYSGVAKMLNGRRLRTLFSTDVTDIEKPDGEVS